MSKKCYVVGVLVFCLIIFSFLICLGCGGSITLPVITIEWKKKKMPRIVVVVVKMETFGQQFLA